MPAAGDVVRPDPVEIRALYAENRFVDAYPPTRALWSRPEVLDGFDVEELIFAGRLAGRLGSDKLRRALFRLAAKREPENPYVRYYCALVRRRRRDTLYAHLRELDRRPTLDSDDADLCASWFAEHAMRLTYVRDFEWAHRCLARAHELGEPNAWLDACHASVLLAEDRFAEAHALAERAWSKSPGMPMAAGMLGATLSALGRQAEAADRLLAFSRSHPQSYEVLAVAIRSAFVVAERSTPEEQRRRGAELMIEAERLISLAPLADRSISRTNNAMRLHAAQLAGDRSAVKKLAAEIRSPFYIQVAKHIEANPEGERVLLEHRFSRQRHNTCLPASLASCLGAFGVALDHDAVAQELTFEGTSWWRVAEWARKQGYETHNFIADGATAVALISAGVPFIIAHESLNSAHACAVVGVDRAMGTLLYHDPQADFLGEVLIEGLGQLEAPLGPRAMLVLPAGVFAARLSGIVLPEEAEETARVELERIIECGPSPEAFDRLIAGLDAAGARGPVVEFLRARVASLNGRPARALELYKSLLASSPQAIVLQRSVINSVAALGNTAELRETLRSILERVPLPGIAEKSDWIHPDAHLGAWYADLLRQSAAHHSEAERHLERALMVAPRNGEPYHILGDLLVQKGEREESLLAYRIASTVEYANDHYAGAYAGALQRAGREAEAIAWLERRVAYFAAGEVGGDGPWMSLIQTCESFGLPEKALADLVRARSARPKSGELAAFAVGMFARYGRMREAEAALADAKAYGSEGQYRAAAIPIARISGGAKAAYEHARAWVESAPTSIVARRALIELTEERDGAEAARLLALRWTAEFPKDEGFEDILLDVLGKSSSDASRVEILNRRLERNPLDGWAWRELAAELNAKVMAAPPEVREKLLPALRSVIERCVATGPDQPFTVAMQGELAVAEGDLERAKVCFRRAIELDCTMESAMVRLARLSANAAEEEKRAVVSVFARALSRCEGHFLPARGVVRELAGLLGVKEAQAIALSWLEGAPDDPALTEAWVDLLLYFGEGRVAAEMVLPRLERAIGRFPIHSGLRHSLAVAYRMLGRFDDAARQLREVTKLAPHNPSARVELADMLGERGQIAEAEKELSKAIEIAPLVPSYWLSLANMLAVHDRAGEAITLLAEAAEKLPNVMEVWERRIELLFIEGRSGEAVEVARRVADLFPDGAYAVLMYARAQRRAPGGVNRAELERLFLRSLDLNALLFDTLDEYVDFLCKHARFEDARRILEEKLPLYEDPLPVRRKLCWVARQRGAKAQALEMLSAVLRERADDVAGWQLLIDWIHQDEAFDVAREVMPRMTAVSLEHTSLHCDRLTLLAKSGAPAAELDVSWEVLTSNFPASMEVNLRRVDGLFIEGRFADAAAKLAAYAAFDDRSPQVLARMVRAAAQRGDEREALELAKRLWLHSADDSAVSVGLALAALEEANLLPRAISEATELIASGERLLPSCMVQIALNAGRRKMRSELYRLIEVFSNGSENFGWDTSHFLAFALDQVANELEEPARVIEFARRFPKRARENVEIWESVGSAHLRAGDAASAKGWFADWRERRGVEMWALTNYVVACWDLGDYQECARSCVDALEQLAHDGTAHLLVDRLMMVRLQMGAKDAFVADMERYGEISRVSGAEGTSRAWIELIYQMVIEEDRAKLAELDRRAAEMEGELEEDRAFFRKRWREWLRPKLSFWGRLWHQLAR